MNFLLIVFAVVFLFENLLRCVSRLSDCVKLVNQVSCSSEGVFIGMTILVFAYGFLQLAYWGSCWAIALRLTV